MGTTKEAVVASNECIHNIRKSFNHMGEVFDKGVNANSSINQLVRDTEDIDKMVNIIISVAEQTVATEEIVASVHEVDEKARLVYEECKRTGKGFYDIGERINAIRLRACNDIEQQDMALAIECSISDHLNCVGRFTMLS